MRLQKMMAVALLGSLASTSAFAQNNNTGEIVIQGVIPGVWELSVFDINSGYDFDLRDPNSTAWANIGTEAAETNASRRVGTIHISTNESSAAAVGATLTIESANAGRMVNDQTVNGVAGLNQEYRLSLSVNDLLTSLGTQGDGTGAITANYTSTLGGGTAGTVGTYNFDITSPQYLNLVNPVEMRFDAFGTTGTGAEELLFDVNVTLGDPTNTVDNRPSAAGVYSDVLTFTIMDDDGTFGS